MNYLFWCDREQGSSYHGAPPSSCWIDLEESGAGIGWAGSGTHIPALTGGTRLHEIHTLQDTSREDDTGLYGKEEFSERLGN